MEDYKMQSATEALKFISQQQVIGVGAGSTISLLIDMIAGNKDLSASLIFTSSSFKTTNKLREHNLKVQAPDSFKSIDIYFDGCDQFDSELNALKSGGGIHTTEKVLASMATEFILIGDSGKFVNQLNTKYPLVAEILPSALSVVIEKLKTKFPAAVLNLRISNQKDGAVISDNGNYLLDITFEVLPDLAGLNTFVKMIPGVVDHSLFYRMATKAIIAGPEGIKIITPGYK
jgi:ribose 5-phosphate isomerase A